MALRRYLTMLFAAVLVFLMAAPVRGEAAETPFIFSDPPFGPESYTASVGLMNAQGKILVPAEYDYGITLRDEKEIVRAFSFHKETLTREGMTQYVKSALYDARGRLLAKGSYLHYACLGANFAATRMEGDNYTVDLLDSKGNVVKNGYADSVTVLDEGAYVAENYLPNGMSRSVFFDENLDETASMTYYSLRTYWYGFSSVKLFPIKLDEQSEYGYINARGDMVIEPQFLSVESFSDNGYAIVMDSTSRYGLIDTQGDYLSAERYQHIYDYGNGYIVRDDHGEFVMGPQGKQLTRPKEYASYITGVDDDDPLTIATKASGLSDILDSEGNILLSDICVMPTPVLEGCAILTEKRDGFDYISGICDVRAGKTYPLKAHYEIYLGQGRMVVETEEGTLALYDLTGTMLYEAEYIYPVGEDGVYTVSKKRYGKLMYGLIDKDGNEVLPIEYSGLSELGNTFYFAAQRGSEMGFITRDGEWIYRESVYSRLMD